MAQPEMRARGDKVQTIGFLGAPKDCLIAAGRGGDGSGEDGCGGTHAVFLFLTSPQLRIPAAPERGGFAQARVWGLRHNCYFPLRSPNTRLIQILPDSYLFVKLKPAGY